jgi:hypothetical protein
LSRNRNLRLIALALVTAWGGAACSWERVHRFYPIPFYDTKVKGARVQPLLERPPRRIAILPFTSGEMKDRERQEAVKILRETFYIGLSRLRSYEVVDLAEVDRQLARAGIAPESLEKHSAQELGRLTGSDAVLFGHVKAARNLTLYVYSHTVYDGTFRLVEAGTGDVLWRAKLWEGRRAGVIIEAFVVDMFLSQPKNKPPQAYRDVAESMVMKLLARIPEPAHFQTATEGLR